MRYASIRKMDISNGNGIRVSLFVQGCKFHCRGCFNSSTWDFNEGKEWNKEIEDEFLELCKLEHIVGVSILGGEPFQQDESLYKLLVRINNEVNKPISLWTGYTFETIPQDMIKCLDYIDELTDGQFIEELKDFKLYFKGSSNQRTWRKNKNGVWYIYD